MKTKSAIPCFTVLLALFIGFSVFSGVWADADYKITVLHTNDFHGASMKLLAERAALIKEIRAESSDPVLLLDAGDVFTRGKYAKQFGGAIEFAVFNALQYDALTLGNNEFKFYGDVLTRRIQQAQFPILAANAKLNGNQYIPGVKPYIIKDLGGFRVAVFGVTTLKAASYKETKGVKFSDPLISSVAVMNELDGKADAVLALTHIGLWDDKKLAKSVPGITAIIGGDSHNSIHSPVKEHGVPIVQAGSNGRYLGRLDLTFEKKADGRWVLKKYKGKLYDLWEPDVKQDDEIRQIIEEYTRLTEKKAS